MASAPSDSGPILGRVDAESRLIAADPQLEQLQKQAGAQIGDCLALPQLAAIVRVARRLRTPLSRRVLAAGTDQDIDMWVRAVPEGDEIALTIEKWVARPAAPPRLAAIAAVEHETLAPEPLSWSVNENLRFVQLASSLSSILGDDEADCTGKSLTSVLRLEEGEGGKMPLLEALASRTGFTGQRASVRATGQKLLLDGEVLLGLDQSFAGFEGSATTEGASSESGSAKVRPTVDGAIQTALRSPLDRIVRSADEMRSASDATASDEYVEYASDIATAARHLLSVIRSLGDGAQSETVSEVDLAELAAEAVALVESSAQERGIAISVESIDALPALGETRSVIQILVNLIGNAIRYSPSQSAVTITFEQSGDRARVHVADEGPGIEVSDRQRIFEPFQKGAGAEEGSGLGLAIARRLARAMGGDIELETLPVQGSRFTLALPRG